MTDRTETSETAATRVYWSGWGTRPPQIGLRVKNSLSAIVLAVSTFLLVAKYMT